MMNLPPRPRSTLDDSHRVYIVPAPSTLASPPSTSLLDDYHRGDIVPTPSTLASPPSTSRLDDSHRADIVHMPSTVASPPLTSPLDDSHRDKTYHDTDDNWERPTLGNKYYPPVYAPKNLAEHEYFRASFPYDAAISCTRPLVR